MSQFGASIEERQTQLFNKRIPCFSVDEAPTQVCDDVFPALCYLRQNNPNHDILGSDV
jgi:hypothetical protein